MINWDELKHIHVIRKLEQILAQWFCTGLFFVDERGQIKNIDSNNMKTDESNSLFQAFIKNERSKLLLLKSFADANEKALASSESSFSMVGPGGVEQLLVAKIQIDKDFLGSVIAYSFTDKEITEDQKQKALSTLQSMGIQTQSFELAFSKIKPIEKAQIQYFKELVSLVSQEIVTFHTEITKREEKINALNHQLGERYSYDSMIGKSKPMQDLYSILDKIKNSESTVLIQGENGTGKELIARAIHYNSPKKDQSFITVNCSAFNENLLDSELFGHVKGSFTGAVKDKKGLFEAADHGTLFLDEIGDMPLSMQVKLLRVLQDGSLTPVGSTEVKKVDVRVVAATNKDLKEMIEDGTFREDLYYRINVINLIVPPLRDRKEDIPILIDHFISRGCKEKNIPIKLFEKRTLEKIFDYPWPGNIRELENEVERLIVLSGEDKKIPSEILSQRIRESGDKSKGQGIRASGKLKDSIEELEKAMIREGLKRTNWNKSRLAKELGISRAGLIMKVEKYQLDKRKIPRPGSSEAA